MLSYTEPAARHLADLIDQARADRGWSVADLATHAGVSRPTVSRLINHAQIPVRQRTRDAIGIALGWQPGACDAVLGDLTKTIRCLVCGGALGRLRTWSGGFGNASTCGIMGHAVMGTDL
ncbi:helix-turn-helix domain-containing protein [Mycolicibacterium fortuitum]|uniref:helix-turn-helix domain-containing protein n=1 Tax=Mycolicibacterium fortuitum TaxID=1766 RepID=UPI0007EA29BC|nr:hypothetical protein A5754_22265 [Mycolicibacterium fortuitum]OBB62501.1 hypothetical protein A5755_22755 [Mycolicibacterium fortuitum]OBF76397.1 hypothetical protein A5751_24320 [Mycolicibacterium fortuitum]